MSTPLSTRDAQASAARASLDELDAMACLARDTNLVVHVVVRRAPGVVEHARRLAREFDLDCAADVRAHSVRIRFDPAILARR
jgi:hypothetical protein